MTSAKTCFFTWATLIVLLLATLGSAYVPLGSLNTVINLAIAAAKAVLVMLVFMHLRRSGQFIKIIAADSPHARRTLAL